ncbi:MAG TPA: DNA polymerase III subunit gamma/tau [Actinomycetota bacterium]
MADEKQYQSLYRKYRPQGPNEVLGQEHVIRALMGAVREGRLAHAFLFTGPRGTGKTSTARILAKMVNCEHGPTPEPCGTCEQCLRIREGTHLDVVEIDAASHGGVDDARELREKAPTAPVQGREKVYIIDEAQRLSREAFDALLKVFEEPPVGVRFILATTEPHKMPATIIGRCQRFDFRRIPAEVVADLLLRIAKDEGLALSADAAQAIARQTEGSARDALSLMDQASVLGAGQIGEEVVASLVGAGPSDVQFALADAVAVGDARTMFELVNGIVQEGRDLRHVTSESLTHFRNLLLARTAPEQGELLDVTEDEVEKLRAQAAKFSSAELARVMALLLAAQTDMRWTTSPRLTLELALVRATIPETDAQPHGLISRLERLERLAGIAPAAASGAERPPAVPLEPPVAPGPPEPATASGSTAPSAARGVPEPAAPAQPVVGAGTAAVDVSMIRSSWGALVGHLRSERKLVIASFLEVATPAAFDGDTLELVFPPDRPFGASKVEEREGELRGALQAVLGIAPRIRCVVRDAVAGPTDPEEDEPPLSEAEALARLKAELGASVPESD